MNRRLIIGAIASSITALVVVLAGSQIYERYYSTGQDSSLVIVSWNIEADGSDAQTIGKTISTQEDCALWGLCEVDEYSKYSYLRDASTGRGSVFRCIVGMSSFEELKLAILYDSSRLKKISVFELNKLKGVDDRGRYPLCVHFWDRQSKREFLFVMNHFRRTDVRQRNAEATGLRAWAEEQTLPVIIAGDLNMDWDIETQEGNDAFITLTEGDCLTWIKPAELKKTQISEDYNSILDATMVNSVALDDGWSFSSEILAIKGDFPTQDELNGDDGAHVRLRLNSTSDHRPIRTVAKIPGRI